MAAAIWSHTLKQRAGSIAWVARHPTGVARAQWRTSALDDVHPLIEAVMPDDDGVIRGRWEPLTLQRTS